MIRFIHHTDAPFSNPKEIDKIEGRVRIITAEVIALAWFCQRTKKLKPRTLRAWLALHEMEERRTAHDKDRAPINLPPKRGHRVEWLEELQKLLKTPRYTPHLAWLRRDLRQLQRMGLVTLANGRSTFPTSADQVTGYDREHFYSWVTQIPSRNRKVPMPRRALRSMSSCQSVLTIGYMLAQCIRGLFYKSSRGVYRIDVRSTRRWMREVMMIPTASLDKIRRKLKSLGWLKPLATAPTLHYRHGSHDELAPNLLVDWNKVDRGSTVAAQDPKPTTESDLESAAGKIQHEKSYPTLEPTTESRYLGGEIDNEIQPFATLLSDKSEIKTPELSANSSSNGDFEGTRSRPEMPYSSLETSRVSAGPTSVRSGVSQAKWEADSEPEAGGEHRLGVDDGGRASMVVEPGVSQANRGANPDPDPELNAFEARKRARRAAIGYDPSKSKPIAPENDPFDERYDPDRELQTPREPELDQEITEEIPIMAPEPPPPEESDEDRMLREAFERNKARLMVAKAADKSAEANDTPASRPQRAPEKTSAPKTTQSTPQPEVPAGVPLEPKAEPSPEDEKLLRIHDHHAGRIGAKPPETDSVFGMFSKLKARLFGSKDVQKPAHKPEDRRMETRQDFGQNPPKLSNIQPVDLAAENFDRLLELRRQAIASGKEKFEGRAGLISFVALAIHSMWFAYAGNAIKVFAAAVRRQDLRAIKQEDEEMALSVIRQWEEEHGVTS